MFAEHPANRAQESAGGRSNQERLGQRWYWERQHAPSETGEHRDGCTEQHAIRRSGRERERRGDEETNGFSSFTGRGEFVSVPLESSPQFGLRLGRVFDTERSANLADLGHIAVGEVVGDRAGAVALPSAKETVGLGAVHPGQEMGIEGRVGASIGGGSLHTGVDRSHGRNDLVGFSDGTERGGAEECPGPVR